MKMYRKNVGKTVGKVVAGILAAGMLVTAFPTVSYARKYEYDKLGRITKEYYDDGSYISYSYDAGGNITGVVSHVTEESSAEESSVEESSVEDVESAEKDTVASDIATPDVTTSDEAETGGTTEVVTTPDDTTDVRRDEGTDINEKDPDNESQEQTTTGNKEKKFTIKSLTIEKTGRIIEVGDKLILKATSINYSGKVKYKFTYSSGKNTGVIRKYSAKSIVSFRPSKSGIYYIMVYAKDSRKTKKKTIKINVLNTLAIKNLKINKSKDRIKKGQKIRFTMRAAGGSGYCRCK